MTTLWHTTLIIAFFFFLFAVLTRLRIKMEPKNTRLDDLIIKFTTLETEIHQLKDTIDKNMETRDQKLIEAFRKALEENNVKLEEKLKEVFRTPKGRRS